MEEGKVKGKQKKGRQKNGERLMAKGEWLMADSSWQERRKICEH